MTFTMTLLAAAATATLAAQSTTTPHAQAPDDRAQHAMGFDQEKTTHHFRIEAAGGTIEVTAKDASDRTSINEINMHLRHITTAFAAGDFALPMFVHDTQPPGVAVMKERRQAMTFTYTDLEAGGKVVIRTADASALEALHEFLRFQIREHKTGDPMGAR